MQSAYRRGFPHTFSNEHNPLSLVDEGAGITLVDPASASEFTGRNIVYRSFSVFIDAGFQMIRPADHGRLDISERFAAEFSAFLKEQPSRL